MVYDFETPKKDWLCEGLTPNVTFWERCPQTRTYSEEGSENVHVFRYHANFQRWKALNTSFANIFFIVRMHLVHKDLPFIPSLNKAPFLIELRSSLTLM